MGTDLLQVLHLVLAAPLDGRLAGFHAPAVLLVLLLAVAGALAIGLVQVQLHSRRRQAFTAGDLVQVLDRSHRGALVFIAPLDLEVIAAAGDADIEMRFQLVQVFIELAAQVGQTAVVGWFEFKIQGFDDFDWYVWLFDKAPSS